jgi:hypothetical protein
MHCVTNEQEYRVADSFTVVEAGGASLRFHGHDYDYDYVVEHFRRSYRNSYWEAKAAIEALNRGEVEVSHQRGVIVNKVKKKVYPPEGFEPKKTEL